VALDTRFLAEVGYLGIEGAHHSAVETATIQTNSTPGGLRESAYSVLLGGFT